MSTHAGGLHMFTCTCEVAHALVLMHITDSVNRNATLCGDRACRRRDAGEIAFVGERGQPSAEIVHVEGAECR